MPRTTPPSDRVAHTARHEPRGLPAADVAGRVWVWPATADSVGPARQEVVTYSQGTGVAGPLAEDIRLAVSEACTNVVIHAYTGGPVGTFTVTAERRDRDVLVSVVDAGGGTRPRPDSPGLGLGLPLMTRLTHGLTITRPDGGGTKVAMRFSLDGPR